MRVKKQNISVIIPMYNASDTIRKTLDSIKYQTKLEYILEVIIIDDGSTDESANIVKEYCKENPEIPIKYIFQKNSGVSVARNKGLKNAKGDLIAFLDADDIWMKNKIERQVQVLKENEEIIFLGTAHKDKPLKRNGKNITSLYRAKLEDVLWSYFPVTPSVIFKREAIREVGYFDEKQSYCEDINYYLRFLLKYNYYYLPEKLVQIDCGKKFMREKGLTSNIRMMHRGEMKNLTEVYENGYLSLPKYVFFFWFTEMKYFRRCIITFISRIKNRR